MPHRIPRHLPPLDFLLKELGYTPVKAAQVLHVSTRTIYHWLKSGSEPYAPRLALFWLTSWGYNIIHTAAHNDACRFAALARSQKDYIAKMQKKALIVQMEEVNRDTKPANDKIFKRFDAESVLRARRISKQTK